MSFEYDSDVSVKPEYLTKEIYENIVKNAMDIKSPEVVKVLCSMGSKSGDNLCSHIYRMKIYYKKDSKSSKVETLSIITKSMPPSEDMDFLEPLQTFAKEKSIYTEILPRLEDIWKRKFRFSPRMYLDLAEPIQTIVFEDLNTLDYKMASRERGLDETHTLFILKRLGLFHASTMVLDKENPNLMKKFPTGLIADAALKNETGLQMKFVAGSLASLIALVEKWPGYETITQKLRNYAANLRKKLLESAAPSPKDSYRVLNHGDLWVNNMLFKYDSTGKVPLDILLIDFQMSVYGSAGLDLNYFFYTSLQLDLLKNKSMMLLEYYHKELCAALKQLNYAHLSPTLEQVKTEYRNRAKYGFFAHFAIFPTISVDKNIADDVYLGNFTDEDFARKKFQMIFQSKRLEENMRFTLPYFDKLGVFD